jgi:hypothetical protein
LCRGKHVRTLVVPYGDLCSHHPDGLHRLSLTSLPEDMSSSVVLLNCACGLACTLLFNGRLTVARLALSFWTVPTGDELGPLTLTSLLTFCESYRSNIAELQIKYPVPGYLG